MSELSDVIELAKLYLKKWFSGVQISVNNDHLKISKQKMSFENFPIDIIKPDNESFDNESFDIENKMNSILTSKLEKAVEDIFTDDMIQIALIESDVIKTVKTKIGAAIKAIVIRDAHHIVNEALGNLENNFKITNKIEKYVENKILKVFE